MVLLLDLTFRYTGKFIDLRHVYRKLTIIWAPQSGTSAEGAYRIGCERHRRERAVGGPTWVLGQRRELPIGFRGGTPATGDFRIYR